MKSKRPFDKDEFVIFADNTGIQLSGFVTSYMIYDLNGVYSYGVIATHEGTEECLSNIFTLLKKIEYLRCK